MTGIVTVTAVPEPTPAPLSLVPGALRTSSLPAFDSSCSTPLKCSSTNPSSWSIERLPYIVAKAKVSSDCNRPSAEDAKGSLAVALSGPVPRTTSLFEPSSSFLASAKSTTSLCCILSTLSVLLFTESSVSTSAWAAASSASKFSIFPSTFASPSPSPSPPSSSLSSCW